MLAPFDDATYKSRSHGEVESESDYRLASHPGTPPETLDALARRLVDADDSPVVRETLRRIAENPSTSPATLARLCKLHHPDVLASVLKHESTPVGTLRGFVASSDPAHWNLLVQNRGVSERFIEEVVAEHRGHASVALCALVNRALSDVAFERIAAELGSDWAELVDGLRELRAGRW